MFIVLREKTLKKFRQEIRQEFVQMGIELDNLAREVAETRGAVDSAIVFINGLAAEIRANAADKEAMLALADDLDAQQADLAAAMQPAEEPPVEEPPVEEPPVEPEV